MSDYLLVPTNLQAFVVGRLGDEIYDLATVPRTEGEVSGWYTTLTHARPFLHPRRPSLKSGVHLHWALPAALIHGRHVDNTKPEQPYIPNRWLVLRMWHVANSPQISSQGWVIESDNVGPDLASEATPFPFFEPTLPVELNGQHCGYVGRTVLAEVWQETHAAYRFDLKSFGWGDPSFAAYYPACKGVLGFHDMLEGVAEGTLLTYLVLGWYSDPAKEPLHPSSGPETVQQFTGRLANLGWSCSNLDGLNSAALPMQTLCHGGVVGLEWQGADQQYPSAPFDATTVTIGGSAAEAFAALLAPDQKQKSLQQVLCAFQHGQATQVSRPDQLGDLLHRHSFSVTPGGTLWAIEPIARSASAQSSPPPMTETVQQLLSELNEAQQALDQHARGIESLRARLFACWVTWANQQGGPQSDRPNRNGVDAAARKLKEAIDGLKQHEATVTACKHAVTQALPTEKTGMQLAESTMPPFLHPKDPFVVLKGENLIGIDRARAQRPDKDADGVLRLRCRLAQDVVSGVKLTGTEIEEWSAVKYFTLNLPNAPGVSPGEVVRTLALETLLFDPHCANLIPMDNYLLDNPELFKALQESLDLTRTSGPNTLAWVGQPPDPLGSTRWGETNPWLSVYLMWQARWVPAYAPVHGSDRNHSKALDDWQFESFDANTLTGDLVLRTSALKQSESNASLLEGATIISALSGSELAENITKFAAAAEPLHAVGQTLVLGQSLGGFNDLLLRQTLALCLPPVDPTNTQVAQVDTAIWEAMGRAPQPTMPVVDVDGAFLPVRAGALKLVNLYVVDAFGQTRKLIDASNPLARQPDVIAAATLPPPADSHAGFSPRLVQPARLNFDWRPADAKTQAPGPVCGWIVANFLEKSFAIFEASGKPLGTLESVLCALGEKTIESKVTFNWHPIPGSQLEIGNIGNERLRRFVHLVNNFTTDEGQAFLELVDLVLRKTEERLAAEDPALAVLLGRPLALVHASLGLEVQGLPAGYWKTSSEFETEGFEQLHVPVRLGGMNLPADGLVGYLPENENSFFTSEGATRSVDGSSRVKYDQQLTVACADEPVSLTLLMDASAQVHASTGILPRHRVVLPAEAARLAGLIEEVYFSVAPVLAARPHDSAAQPTMPLPSDAFGQWSWATRPDITANRWHEIRPADDRGRFVDGLALSEGWLRLQLRRDQDHAAPGS